MKIIKFITLIIITFYTDSTFAQNATPQISDEQAHEIVLNGTPEDVKKLLETGYDVNKVYLCNTLLNEAVKSSARGKNANKYPSYALDKIKILVKAGANINLIPCDGFSMTALHWAISLPLDIQYLEGDANKVIDEKIKNKIGECNFPGIVSKPCGEITSEEREKIRIAIKGAMRLAYSKFPSYFMEIIDFLVKSGADINLKAGTLGTAPLHIAATNPQDVTLEPLQYLIANRANLNIQDNNGNTPLFWAYGINNSKAVDMLINAGANTEIVNKEGVVYKNVEGKKIRGFIDDNANMIFDEF